MEHSSKKPIFRRDLPDGSRQYFEHHVERPHADQLYYDDIVHIDEDPDGSGLTFLFFGKERSYPSRAVLHQTRNYILHYITDGSGTFNGRTLHAGDGFLVTPDVSHKMEADSRDPWHFKWIAFRGSDAMRQMKRLGLDEEHLCFTFSFGDRLEELFDDLLYREHSDCDMNTYMQGIFYILLSYQRKEYLNSLQKTDRGSHYADRAMAYIDRHYKEPLRVDDIAASLHISRKYLCTILDQQIGMSTKDYLLTRRVQVAADLLLHTDLSVSEIAAEVGYTDYTQFSRMFRKKTGLSPRAFAKQARQNTDPTQGI